MTTHELAALLLRGPNITVLLEGSGFVQRIHLDEALVHHVGGREQAVLISNRATQEEHREAAKKVYSEAEADHD
jgi:hypothetical protein